MIALFTITIFAGSALLFLVQPMFARMVLPLLGGSPSVWNTAMVFYQAALLAGYGCAHLSMAWLGPRRQVLWQMPLLALALLFLPIAVPLGWSPPSGSNPAPWLLALMTVAVGMPFLAVATMSPVLQKWFSATSHPRAHDPYFLYAASNAGSLLALLGYPLLVEPHWTLEQQARIWAWGYGLLLTLALLCAMAVWKSARAPAPMLRKPDSRPDFEPSEPALLNRRRMHWVVLAFVPSSLVLGVTTFVSSEIAVVPLLWILPLAAYLLTFVIAFSRHGSRVAPLAARAFPILTVGVVVVLNLRATEPLRWLMLLHLAFLVSAAFLCHWRLAQDRPPPGRLTEFYLWLSIGGVLGGIFNALVAPIVFDSLAEYPIAIVLACLVALPRPTHSSRLWSLSNFQGPAVLAAAAFALILAVQPGRWPEWAGIAFGLPALGCYFLSRHPVRFALGTAALLATATVHQDQTGRTLHAERSFFGMHRVTLAPGGEHRLLVHGRTIHGIQSIDPARQRESLAYYHRSGPAGDFMSTVEGRPERRVGVIGLGVGSLASFAAPGQPWTFLEIDPVVVALARDERYFTFLKHSPADLRIVLGDARMSLVHSSEPFDLLVVDAFSSDAIPVHLLTREAVALYLRHLAPHGILAFHISNLHLDLEPVLGALAGDAGLAALVREDTELTPDERAAGKSPSIWLVIARSPGDLEPLAGKSGWRPSRAGDATRLWTDQYSSLLWVFRQEP